MAYAATDRINRKIKDPKVRKFQKSKLKSSVPLATLGHGGKGANVAHGYKGKKRSHPGQKLEQFKPLNYMDVLRSAAALEAVTHFSHSHGNWGQVEPGYDARLLSRD